MNRRASFILAITLLTFASACQRRVATGPPELRLGRDMCAHCGMMISDDRYAGSLLVDRDIDPLLFDDIGCMLDYEREHAPETRFTARFVRDYHARRWLDSGAAHYLCADRDRLVTPMGSGIVAFGTLTSAESKRIEVGGRVCDEATAVRARHEPVSATFTEEGHAPPG